MKFSFYESEVSEIFNSSSSGTAVVANDSLLIAGAVMRLCSLMTC